MSLISFSAFLTHSYSGKPFRMHKSLYQEPLAAEAEAVKREQDTLPWEGVGPAHYYLKNRKERIQVSFLTYSCCEQQWIYILIQASIQRTIVVVFFVVQLFMWCGAMRCTNVNCVQASLLQKPKDAVHSMLKVQPCQDLPHTIDECLNRAPKKKAGRLRKP